jgi:hypothetical protein
MKAYVSTIVKGGINNPQQRGHLTTTDTVESREYRQYHTLVRNALKGKPAGRYHIEAYNDWSQRFYVKPDYETTHTILH